MFEGPPIELELWPAPPSAGWHRLFILNGIWNEGQPAEKPGSTARRGGLCAFVKCRKNCTARRGGLRYENRSLPDFFRSLFSL
jgi:hypothetical protein